MLRVHILSFDVISRTTHKTEFYSFSFIWIQLSVGGRIGEILWNAAIHLLCQAAAQEFTPLIP